jgi:hypothetical protein
MQNRASRRKHHIIYKTTCLVTGKWYIGMHSTDDLEDGYLGSGQVLWKSIKKYGKDQHRCEILEHLPDRETLGLREEAILTQELRTDPLCMNLRSGGTGNYPGKAHTEEVKRKIAAASAAHWKDPVFKEKTGAAISSALKKNWSELSADQKRDQTTHLREALAQRVALDPALKEEMRARGKSTSEKLWANPAHREQMSAKLKERHADPEYKARQKALNDTKRAAREQDPVHKAMRDEKRREQVDRRIAKRKLERSTREPI